MDLVCYLLFIIQSYLTYDAETTEKQESDKLTALKNSMAKKLSRTLTSSDISIGDAAVSLGTSGGSPSSSENESEQKQAPPREQPKNPAPNQTPSVLPSLSTPSSKETASTLKIAPAQQVESKPTNPHSASMKFTFIAPKISSQTVQVIPAINSVQTVDDPLQAIPRAIAQVDRNDQLVEKNPTKETLARQGRKKRRPRNQKKNGDKDSVPQPENDRAEENSAVPVDSDSVDATAAPPISAEKDNDNQTPEDVVVDLAVAELQPKRTPALKLTSVSVPSQMLTYR